MTAPPAARLEVPSGYSRHEVDGAVLVIRDGWADELLAAGVEDPERLVDEHPSPLKGRGRLARIELGARGRAIVRCLQRGGLLGKLVRRLSLDPQRAQAELAVSTLAAERGARTLQVLAAVTRPAPGGFHHGLVTLEEAGARDLLAGLRAEAGRPRRRALVAAGDAIRALHEAGVDHVDLNVKNVLLTAKGEALVIDLDRCRLGDGPLPWERREANLARLLRSWWKVTAAEPGTTQPRDPLALARGYARGERELWRRLVALGGRHRFPCRRALWAVFPPSYE